LKPSSIKEISKNPDENRPVLLGKHLIPAFSDVNSDNKLKLASTNIGQETPEEAAKPQKTSPPSSSTFSVANTHNHKEKAAQTGEDLLPPSLLCHA